MTFASPSDAEAPEAQVAQTQAAQTRSFDHIVFDLDDTLLDTSRLLVPQAALESCQAMVEAGLAATVENCLKARSEFARTKRRYDLYHELVRRFGVLPHANPDQVAQRGYAAFHDREVESHITLFAGALEMIRRLKSSYGVHLVTAGNRRTQEAKIRILGLAPELDSISHVDPSRGERKQDAFAAIMSTTAGRPDRYLSVGNRLDTDVGDARRLGWKGCWVRYGEYADVAPENEFENPDFTIASLEELIATCRL